MNDKLKLDNSPLRHQLQQQTLLTFLQLELHNTNNVAKEKG